MLNLSHAVAVIFVIAMPIANISFAQNQQPCRSKGTITDFAWFAGHWTAEENGSHIDEYWSIPMGGVLPGMIRAGSPEKTTFLEFFTVRETPDGIDLSVRHFSADLTPTEKDKALVFRLKCFSREAITFENTGEGQPRTLLMERPGPDTFRARNEIVMKDGTVRKVDITFTRISH
ncbi:MAG TPA: DUF6265 family protein [Candidatus Angelobacter sp.]|nr:DUF6265 family protein [Candidatus Angelobacter sp.]